MATLSKSVSIGGLAISGSIARSDDGEAREQVTLVKGNAGTLTVRTDNDTGTITASSVSHTITTGMTVDVYWGGATPGVRRGMTVGTVAGTSIPIDLGAGDNLPVATTAVVVCQQTVVTFPFTGDNAILA